MDKRIRLLGMAVALLLSPAAFTPALAQNVGDPCTGTDRQYTVSGPSSSVLICNGSTLELLGKDLSNPVRKGVGTAAPAATLDVAGEAKIGNTSLACSATTEGAMRYNSTSKEMEYCNGTAWASLSPAGGGGLKVYKADGVTVLGNYLGNNSATSSSSNLCKDTLYSDISTGQIHALSLNECSGFGVVGTAYFTGSNCTGTAYINTNGYCCTGSAPCTTDKCATVTTATGSRSYLSSRNSSGVCTNSSGSSTLYYDIAIALCGDSACVVK